MTDNFIYWYARSSARFCGVTSYAIHLWFDEDNQRRGFRMDQFEEILKGKFSWQEGYGAFSYGRSQVDQVYHYVMNQKEHHEQRTFLEEYFFNSQRLISR
jgi:hypothetical protein